MSEQRLVTYRFESEPLAGIDLIVQEMRLVEALNDPYRLDLRVAVRDPDVDLSAMLGKDCVLEIARVDNVRRVCGLVRQIDEAERTDESQTADLIIVPALWMLGLRRNTRIFQEMSVGDILDAVLAESLGPYSRTHELDLQEEYPTREYCVQYQETDLDFCHRLMEEHGISYAFEHEGEQETLLLRDKNDSFAELPSGALVEYRPHVSVIETESEPIHRFHRIHRDTTTSVVVRDWDWTKSGDMTVENEERSEDEQGRDRESYEQGEGRSLQLWDYSPTAYAQVNVDRQALIRKQELVRDQLVGEVIGRVVQVSPGMTFELTGHPAPGFDGPYLIERAVHVSRPVEGSGGGGSMPDPYHNRFEVIPLDVEYRPDRRARKPLIDSIQTAVVTGPSGEEIHTDEHGRIKVQFHWDREGQNDENSSCWIRVQQPWAGPSWGFWYLPRIGMEVVVHFVDGDPDRPLVSGCVYNGTNLPPYPLPDEKTKSTIKSNSSPGGGGFNELRFEDKTGSEEIFTHAQKDYNEVVENDHNTLVHHDQTNTVDNDQTQEIHVDQIEMVHGNQEMTVDGNRTVVVHSNYDETVDGTETRHVVGDVTETFDANETRTVSGNLTETFSANETRTIGGDQTETIMGDFTQTIAASSTDTVSGSRTTTVVGGIARDTPATYDVTADGGMNVIGVAGISFNAAGGIQISAPGGMTMVDCFKNWEGAQWFDYGAVAGAIVGFKDDFTGLAQGTTGLKMEFTGVVAAQTLAHKEANGVALFTIASMIRNRAIRLKTKPSVA